MGLTESSKESLKKKEPTQKIPINQILLFLPLILIMAGDLGVLISNQLLIIVDMKWTASEIGIVIGVQYLVQGCFTFLFGYLSDKLPRKYLLIFGGIIWVIGSLLTSTAWDLSSMLLFRIIASIGLGVQAPVTFSMLSDMFPSEKRSNAFAWWGIANLVGVLAVGSIALSFNTIPSTALDPNRFASFSAQIDFIRLNHAAQSALWRIPYVFIAIVGLFLIGLLFLVKEPKRGSKEKALETILLDDDIDYSKQYKIRKEDIKFVYKRKTNIFLVLNFFDNVTSGVIVSYLLLYLNTEIGLVLNFTNISIDLLLILIGLIIGLGIAFWGQFHFAKLGDKKYKSGDLRGRIKVMVFCALFQIPFLAAALFITPTFGTTKTIFLGAMVVNDFVFWIFFILMLTLIGIGLAGSFGGTPNWYASLIDGNLPEQRGTMIAIASLMDTIGRAVGAFAGAYFFAVFNNSPSPLAQNYPISLMLITVGAVFGIISMIMSVPSLLTCEKDFSEVLNILKQRAAELEKMQKQ
jgi:MFS family permease